MRQFVRTAAVAAGLLVAVAACGGGGGGQKNGSSGGGALKGVHIEVAAKWTGPEQASFEKVLKAFEEQTGATVSYASTGENTDAYLGPRIEGGNPPDVAILPQPGLLRQYARKGELKPLSNDVVAQLDQHYTPYWKGLGTVDGKVYGVLVKAAHKSIVWYRPQAFSDAGVQPPQTWAELVGTTASTLSDAGETPFDVGAKDGWPLTDWFENVYLSQAGPQMYDKLAEHKIPWTDPSVAAALRTLAQVWGKQNYLAGGTKGEMQTTFVDSVTQTFGQDKAAMVPEGDFVASVIAQTRAKVGTDAKIFPFPKVGATAPVVLGGDIAVALKDDKGAMALLRYLATPQAGEIWARQGGYLSPNKDVPPSAYPDPISRQLAQTIIQAGDTARYDMSDMEPSAFGATPGAGEWKDLQDFFQNPADVKGAQAKLEADARKAFAGAGM